MVTYDSTTGGTFLDEGEVVNPEVVEISGEISRRQKRKQVRIAYEKACKEELCKPKDKLNKITIPLPQRKPMYGFHQYKMRNSKGPEFYKNRELDRGASFVNPMVYTDFAKAMSIVDDRADLELEKLATGMSNESEGM